VLPVSCFIKSENPNVGILSMVIVFKELLRIVFGPELDTQFLILFFEVINHILLLFT